MSSLACAPLEDEVFTYDVVRLVGTEASFSETAGEVTVRLELERPAPRAVSALVTARGVTAQAECFHPDYQLEPERVEWAAGQTEASLALRIIDDELAEMDEQFELVLTEVEGSTLQGDAAVVVRIEDDDRSELFDAAARFGLTPDASEDQSAVLQQALDAAGAAGRGVVVLAPGRYVVRSVTLTPGTSIVGYGAELVRPELAGSEVVTVRSTHDGARDSAMTLLEGLSLDGRREQQGAFEELQQENAHLLFLRGDAARPGRLRATVQSMTFINGTGDGLAVGPNSDVVACGIEAHDVLREGVSLHGGNSRLRVRDMHASATFATTGLWLDGFIPGYEGSTFIDVVLERVQLDTGDLELELVGGSRLEIRELQMAAAPFRLLSPDSSVEIVDSTLQLGLPSSRHNHFAQPGDVRIRDSVIVTSEALDEAGSADPDDDRQWAMVRVLWEGDQPATSPGFISFDGCQFETADDVEATDRVRIAETEGQGGQLSFTDSTALCDCEWFDEASCSGCVRE